MAKYPASIREAAEWLGGGDSFFVQRAVEHELIARSMVRLERDIQNEIQALRSELASLSDEKQHLKSERRSLDGQLRVSRKLARLVERKRRGPESADAAAVAGDVINVKLDLAEVGRERRGLRADLREAESSAAWLRAARLLQLEYVAETGWNAPVPDSEPLPAPWEMVEGWDADEIPDFDPENPREWRLQFQSTFIASLSGSSPLHILASIGPVGPMPSGPLPEDQLDRMRRELDKAGRRFWEKWNREERKREKRKRSKRARERTKRERQRKQRERRQRERQRQRDRNRRARARRVRRRRRRAL